MMMYSTNLYFRLCPLLVIMGRQLCADLIELADIGTEINNKVCKATSTKAICSHKSLTTIPDYLPEDLSLLDLSNNYITEINQTLTKYSKLEELYMSNNQIFKLQTDCFKNLDNLIILDLKGNNLLMNNVTFQDGVFKPLKSLQVLYLNGNNPNVSEPGLSYPDVALSKLSNLSWLHMDGLSKKDFGPGFQNMTSLRNLTMEGPPYGYCNISAISEKMFQHLSQLIVLELRFCFVNGSKLHKLALKPLENLHLLDLSYNDIIYFDHLGSALAEIRSGPLSHLKIDNIMDQFNPCAKVTEDFARNLPRNLTYITASSNGLAIVEEEVFDLLPRNLAYLDLSDNRFVFGSYLKNLSLLENLETLILNGAVQSFDLPKWFSPNVYTDKYQSREYSHHQTWERVKLKLPPNLKTVSINSAGLTYALSEFHIDPNNSLENLILNGNRIQALKGPFTGLINLKNLSLADCYIDEVNDDFFDSFRSLEFLNLSSNTLGSNVFKHGKKAIFKNLSHLKELDLSFTNILKVDDNIFEGLNNLEMLHMQRNGLYSFNVDISHMTKLSFVNFSLNVLTGLNTTITNFFDELALKNNLSIDFTENPIHCYCANLDFITWIAKSVKTINFGNWSRLKCVYEDTSERYQNVFSDIRDVLERECIPKVTLFIVVTAATVLLMCIISIVIIYRFRWKLKYLYYSGYLYMKSKKHFNADGRTFLYDVFVSFANEDEFFVYEKLIPQLRSRGLKVHLHTIDFIAGELITTNIVNAVQSSRRTLIVLSDHMLKSSWCKFELQMANIESVHTGRPVIIFLFIQQLLEETMGKELLYHIQNNTYIQLPNNSNNGRIMELFWSKLCSDLSE
ncbi:hypothetical protein Btru_029281 [Bulinus truncatus]|nr:hypothetical protein Btru_029281 [Bulinus truncatus]